MAIIDSQLLFSQSQSVVGAASTTGTLINSTNVYRQTVANSGAIVAPGSNQARALGTGEPLFGHILCMTAIVEGGTTGVFQIRLVSSAAAALTTPTVHWISESLTDGVGSSADFTVVGNRIDFIVPPGGTWLEYVGFQYVTTGTATTHDISAGAVTTWIDRGVQSNPQYASGLNW